MKTQQLFSPGWSEVTSGERNQIVFEHKNKSYGAFEIRNTYDKSLLKAFSVTVLFILLVSAALLSPKKRDDKQIKPPFVPDTTTFVKPDDHPPVEPPTTPITPPPSNPDAFLKPIVTDDSVLSNLDSTLFMANNNSGSTNGNPKDTGTVDPNIFGTGKENKKPFDDNEPIDGIDVQEVPEFPGGDEALINFIRKHIYYPEIIKEIGGKGVVDVGFLIDKEGNVENVYVRHGCKYNELNNEAVRVIKMLPAWHPGRQQGVAVKVRMNLPVRFELKQ